MIRRAATLPDPSAPGAACVASLALSLLVLALAFTNPYAALLLVPAAHLWMLATLTHVRPRDGIAMFVLGLLPVVAVGLYYLWRLTSGPLDGAYYLFLLVTGDQTGWLTTACGAVLLAITGSVAAIILARIRARGTRSPSGARTGARGRPAAQPRSSVRAGTPARVRSGTRARRSGARRDRHRRAAGRSF